MLPPFFVPDSDVLDPLPGSIYCLQILLKNGAYQNIHRLNKEAGADTDEVCMLILA